MIHRREFMRTSIGLALGACVVRPAGIAAGSSFRRLPVVQLYLTAYERAMARTAELELLGIPRLWSLVRDGFHPFSPERVVIMDRGRFAGPYFWAERTEIRGKVEAKVARWDEKLGYSAEKFNLLIAIIERLVAHYGVHEYFEDWAIRLAVREQLGSSGMGHGLGVVHQFQRKEKQIVRSVANPPVDWWLFLLPEGADFECLDEKPAHALIAHVASRLTSHLELGFLEIASRLGRDMVIGAESKCSLDWQAISHMDRVTAAQTLNPMLAHCLKQGPW